MKCGVIVTTGDPRTAADLAAEAEAAGWDGVPTAESVRTRIRAGPPKPTEVAADGDVRKGLDYTR